MRRSKVARLPRDIREKIERAWRDGRLTLDQIMGLLRENHADVESDPQRGVSRSGLHRYLKSFGDAAERMREAQQIAGSIVAKLGESGDTDLRRMLVQLLSQVALYQLRALENEGAEVKPADLMFLARAVQSIEGASRSGAEMELKLREKLRTETEQKLSRAVRSGGLTADAAAAIRRALAE